MKNKLQTSKPTGLELATKIISKSVNVGSLEISLTVSEALTKPLVRKVFKNRDGEAFTLITFLVKRFVDSFGFSTKMNDTQIEMLAIDTLEYFSYESIEDIILFFKMARSGRFGATIRGVDSNLIFGSWFPMYMELKSNEREKSVQEKKIETSVDKRGVSMDAVIREKEKVYKANKLKEVERYVDKICLNFDRQILEDNITDWSKDDERKEFVYLLKLKRRSIK